jgi:hypothetical protein
MSLSLLEECIWAIIAATAVIACPPQQVGFAAEPDENLVKMPCIAWLTACGFYLVGDALAELVTSAPDRLVRHGHTSLDWQFFDVTQT